ncbi:MAG: GNAT family N-acetyltransferase [Actinomycetota bacterium]
MTTVRPASVSDRVRAVETLTRAFAADPVVRWFFPDDTTYPDRSRAFFGFLIDVRLEGGLVLITEDLSAVSSWDPPGGNRLGDAWVDGRWEAATSNFTPEELARLDSFEERAAPMHPPDRHWYLGIVGVDPDRWGTGLGRAVIEPGLAAADRDGTATYLETGTAENLPIYARLGLTTSGEVSVPDGPTLWGMWRPADRADPRRGGDLS